MKPVKIIAMAQVTFICKYTNFLSRILKIISMAAVLSQHKYFAGSVCMLWDAPLSHEILNWLIQQYRFTSTNDK